jgi:RNA polymerase sigma factor (sigma-70 family)
MGEHGGVRPTDPESDPELDPGLDPEFNLEFRAAWPRIVRVLAAWSGSLHDAEEYAAEAIARAVSHQEIDDIDDLAAWCVRVAKRAWIDDHRRRDTFARLAPDLASEPASEMGMAAVETGELPDQLDDRLALLFVACDEALAPGAQMVLALRVVCGLSIAETAMHLGIQESAAAARLTRAKKGLAQARGEFRVPDARERAARLPVVLDCVAGMFTVAHRSVLVPRDALGDLGAQALSIADALVVLFPVDTEVRGLRAVVRLGLARRPGRVDDEGTAMTLDDVDRAHWDRRLLRAGLADAAYAASGAGRFALEAAISGVHSVAPSVRETDWARIVDLYTGLERVWPSPAVRVALLTARAQVTLSQDGDLAGIEGELESLADEGPSYARRDAAFALADLCWRTGRRQTAAARYRMLATQTSSEAVRRFCEQRSAG